MNGALMAEQVLEILFVNSIREVISMSWYEWRYDSNGNIRVVLVTRPKTND
jgi:hypothetical protein